MTTHRQPKTRISDRLIGLCTSDESVSSLVARDPSLAPGDAWKKLYRERALKATTVGEKGPRESTLQDELEKAAWCGRWGPTKPSELFLRIYHDALCTLEEDPLRAMVSPSLMGSYGTVPLTIISVMPDIVRHMSNVIARAEREVILATNYWQNSTASKYITNAIRELDRRAGARRAKVVLKVLYDRGSFRQLFEPRYLVSEKKFTHKHVNLPHPSEIPNIDMQVMNFHTPLMGTFHAKYMVVDRKIALLQSNNIQDNDNLEMLVHVEGPIVDSLYDMALISWHRKLDPPLPSYDRPAAQEWSRTLPDKTADDAPDEASFLGCNKGQRDRIGHKPGDIDPSAPPTGKPRGTADGRAQVGPGNGKQAVSQLQVKDSPQQHALLPEHTPDDPHYDDDIAGEVFRIQSSLSSKPGETHMEAVTRRLNHTINEGFPSDTNAPQCPPREPMTPYIQHQTRTPYPMALVNRAPYGPPIHRSLQTPQNAAWLSALRNAQTSVLILSPTLNSGPLILAIREACERGIDVVCYICLSYNDAGELLPRQGGHNEGVSAALHAGLSPAGRRRLHYKWYVAKDQTAPLAQSKRLRSSHIKLMIVDGRVAIQGNGNQDTQSWFHSQEVNLLVESEALCAEWVHALERNQNTRLFGAVQREDGVWRDREGREADGALGVNAGPFGWVRGAKGAIQRLRGTGGF
ncbi:Minor cardiolipin synthase ClsB [Madurella mycetomatis]|uniref:Minor cardiolipin synthase ClsB n=1 Tax=Madurella mycetomatis TaxID=100816 RepID=A0A175VZ37_9PEZI|nr:Minor cardiolipin synthase ClsB [Madurella mycetomatis]